MSFGIKDKKKIQLLRKCVQILTQDSETLSIHFTKTDIRFFTQNEDTVTYMCDFTASWFSKFVPPEVVSHEKVLRLQVTCHRDTFLQSFNIIDDTELEFMVVIKETDEGELKVIKTRDLVIVESRMAFKVDQDVTCDETYIFPPTQLLIKGRVSQFKPVKDIFKKDAKSEAMQMEFSPDKLTFAGIINKKFGYEIAVQELDQYGVYLARQHELATNYKILIPLKHLLGLLKVAELVDGDFNCAMECISEDSAVCFFFTKSSHFTFNIGLAAVQFENKDPEMIDNGQIGGIMVGNNQGRLKKGNMNMMQPSDASIGDGDINTEMKQEAGSEQTGIDVRASRIKESPKDSGVKQSSSVVKESTPGSARRRAMVVADEQVEGEEAKMDQQMQDEELDPAQQEMLTEKEKEKRAKKERFYDEVDNEEFF